VATPATVLLPVYNAEKYLVASLESLLAQTHADFEVLAIDDASEDGSAKILEDYANRDRRIRVLTQPRNSGLVEVLNLGLRSIRTPYVIRHDADDRAHPERLERTLRFFARHPDTVLVGTGIRRVDASGVSLGEELFPTSDAELRWQLLFRNPFAHPATAFDREKAESVGGYAPSAEHAEDYDLWIRLAAVGKIANLPEVLCDYRVHDEAVSIRRRAEMEAQTIQIGTQWASRYFGKSESFTHDWEKFRQGKALSSGRLHAIVTILLAAVEKVPELSGYPRDKSTADLAWHLMRYFKKNPVSLLDFGNIELFARLAPALRNWPARRWRVA
jgi:glycosyltransferase involved in cell wall biosynthesis